MLAKYVTRISALVFLEYICPKERRCVFSTCELEKGKVVLQLGTANGALAVQAAKQVLQVCKIPLLMSLPPFTLKG